ncbi:hypothetical protein GS399_07495 [Pedobacter sp. HMF7647]|uniref:Uncharacterized protein n=1 Tax=Hufsiella arboris TaxID=2695275 RepID=A0A7K1Y893_9SPHI|nr:hypothetical protein [Hufsiella arboris]MXV50814.1 hypothetical protein [Hufsiella arboris]
MNQTMIILFFCALAFVLLLIKEIRRQNKAHLIWRIIATFFAIVSLALLIVPSVRSKKNALKREKAAILLTPNFNRDSVLKFLMQQPDSTPVFFTDESLADSKNVPGKYYPGISYFLAANPLVNKVEIFGSGLNNHELVELDSMLIRFHPASNISGFQQVNWRRDLKQGDILTLAGLYENAEARPVKLVLKALNTTVDSTEIAAGKTGIFKLQYRPKQTGLVNWLVYAISGNDTLSRNPVPFIIHQPQKINVLMLFSSPGFESRFLKNWLEQNGFGVVVKTLTSKGKFNRNYSNLRSFQPDKLSRAVLDSFDVVIADAFQLDQLNGSDVSVIQNALLENGTGLIALTDTAWKNGPFNKFKFTNGAPHQELSLSFRNEKAKLQVEQSMFIQPQSGSQPLVTDAKQRIVVNSKLHGSGKFLVTTLSNTYSWMLSGDKETYTSFWSYLIENAGRKITSKENWFIDKYPRANQYTVIKTSGQQVPIFNFYSQPIFFSQKAQLPISYESVIWPKEAGWQKIAGQDVYVFSENDWKDLIGSKNNVNYKPSIGFIESKTNREINSTSKYSTFHISPLLLLAIFSICCVFLWVETKLL